MKNSSADVPGGDQQMSLEVTPGPCLQGGEGTGAAWPQLPLPGGKWVRHSSLTPPARLWGAFVGVTTAKGRRSDHTEGAWRWGWQQSGSRVTAG